jgi:hypothetical protein
MPAELLILLSIWTITGLVDLGSRGIRRRRDRRRQALWRQAAQAIGLESIEEIGSAVRSRRGKLLVRFGKRREDEWNSPAEIEIAGPGLAPRLTLRPETAREASDVTLGDDDFDREVRVEGSPALALAILDNATRQAVRSLLRGPFEVDGLAPLAVTGRVDSGLLRIWIPQQQERQEQLVAVVRAGLALGVHLMATSDLATRLARNLALESNMRVRRRILLTLVREFPDHEATREALRAMRNDRDAELRLQAGIALGLEGRDILMEVAANAKAADKASARAVTALGPSLTLDEATNLLKEACRAVRVQTARACVGIIGTHGRDAMPLLCDALTESALGDVAARALGAMDDPSAEAPLLRALAEGSPSVRRAAAQALGRVGTRDAVAALRQAEAEADLRPAARQAIASIHSRLAGAGQGQLSLAEDQAGRVSLAETNAGQLSLSDEKLDGAKS